MQYAVQIYNVNKGTVSFEYIEWGGGEEGCVCG